MSVRFKSVVSFTLGVVGALVAPQLAVIAALVALAREYTIVVEHTGR